ncbi:T4 family baseplate hub assembly chaperone [Nonomuraea sp. SYSU D8015]|uniref:T4 family baseplate hub assembly chaperone n=1 Tax=Nonomuraea sp. SYSU D8015 TaxID=2593644 RepID=UPI001660508F|nr:hypothetical protein [Nonomuraea sp. SYSU D8015]
MPQPEPPTDDVVELACGLTLDGQVVRTARVRELTGADEEAISRAALSSAPEAFVSTLLERGTAFIGDRPATQDLLNQLVVGDRDILLLGIRKATYGDKLTYELTCQGCKQKLGVTVGLEEIPITKSPEPGVTEFVVSLRRGVTAQVRMIRGKDQNEVVAATRDKDLTVAEADTLLLARTVISLTGPTGNVRPVAGHPTAESAMREMGLADRAAILDELRTRRVGPDEEGVPITCAGCGHEQKVQVTLAALFRWN